jgi:hypothetical protein
MFRLSSLIMDQERAAQAVGSDPAITDGAAGTNLT